MDVKKALADGKTLAQIQAEIDTMVTGKRRMVFLARQARKAVRATGTERRG